MDTIWVIVALLVGALLGGSGVYLVARRRWADAARSEELQRQLDGYKQEVSDHFVETAELVNKLTHSYKAVFDHLEQGAYRLVDEETLRKQLGDVDAESVRLEYIGRRNKAAVLGAGSAAPAASADTPPGWGTTSTGPGAAGSSEPETFEASDPVDPASASDEGEDGPAGWTAQPDEDSEREKAARSDGHLP